MNAGGYELRRSVSSKKERGQIRKGYFNFDYEKRVGNLLYFLFAPSLLSLRRGLCSFILIAGYFMVAYHSLTERRIQDTDIVYGNTFSIKVCLVMIAFKHL